MNKENQHLRKLVYTAMFAVINYIAFEYGKINIPLPGGLNSAIHIANAVVVLSAWLLGPVYGGLAGGIGLSLADLMDPRYVTSAPKTFIMKFLIGYIAGKTAQNMHLSEETDRQKITKITTISACVALGFNVLVDPIVGYLYKKYLLKISVEAAGILLAWTSSITAINAVICVIISVLLYQALYKSFRSIGEQ